MMQFVQKNYDFRLCCRVICSVAMLAALLVIGAPMLEAATPEAPVNGEQTQPVKVEDRVIDVKSRSKSLKSVLEAIKSKGVEIIYNDSSVAPYKNVAIQASSRTVSSILIEVLKGTKLEYAVVDNVIAIRPKAKAVSRRKIRRNIVVSVFDKYSKDPITGATAFASECNVGNYTVNGKTTLSVVVGDAEDVLLDVSMLGMKSQNILLEPGKNRVSVYLEEDVEVMDDVVVTGYANIDKASFTGSTTRISNEQMLQVSTTNPLAALSVFDPSMRMVTNTTMGSDPNTMPEFYIRGQSGISGVSELDQLTSGDISEFSLTNNPNAPVFMLDGYEVSMEYVYDMDPMRIKSMTILKDAASTAIYGSKAANGVIVIETIAPQVGKLRVSYGFTGSVTAPDLSSYNLMNAKQKLELDLAAGILDPSDKYPSYMKFYRNNLNNIMQGVDTYWLSQPLQVQFNQAHSLYIEGGESSLRFGLGLRYDNQNGVMKESFRDNISAELKVDYRLSDKIQFTNVATLTNSSSQDSPYGNFSEYTGMLPYWSPYDLETGELVPAFVGANGSGVANPLFKATLGNFNNTAYTTLSDNIGFNYFFLKNFQLKFQFAINYTQNETNDFTSPSDPEFDSSINNTETSPSSSGRLNVYNTDSFDWSTNLYMMYNKSLGLHNLNFTFGANAASAVSNSAYYSYRGFANETLWQPRYASDISSKPSFSDNITRLIGGFLMGNYTYKDTYLLDVSLRLDGSSEFGSDNRVAPFWSFGAGLNLHKYEFFKEMKDVVNLARITANYGQTGKLDFSPYMAKNTYNIDTDRWYSTGLGASLVAMGNPNLAWEKTNTLNISTDWAFFKNRLCINLTYYNKLTDNLLTDMSLPASSGFASYKENMGKVQNVGYEANLNVTAIRKKNFDLNLMATAAHNKNEIIEISDAMKAYNDRVNSYYSDKTFQTNAPMLQYVEGGSLSSIFGVRSLGISPASGKELFLTKDGDITTEWNANDQVIIGSTEPTLQGALGLNIRYKQFTMYASFVYGLGGDVYNTTLINNIDNADIINKNADVRVMDRWKEIGDLSPYKELNYIYPGTTQPTSRFVQKENYLMFNSLSLGYTVDAHWMDVVGISMLRLQANMNDLATFSTIRQERGLAYPYARTFSLSANISF